MAAACNDELAFPWAEPPPDVSGVAHAIAEVDVREASRRERGVLHRRREGVVDGIAEHAEESRAG